MGEEDGSLFFPKQYYERVVKTSGREKVHMDLNFQYGQGDNRHMDTDSRGRDGGRDGGDAPPRNDSPVESGGFGGGFGGCPADDPGIALEDDAEFPSLH